MRAMVLERLPADELVLREVEEPTIQHPDDVLIAVEDCGVCGTDLHILDGDSYRPDLPFVLGHESVGVVVDAGPEVSEELRGSRVTMTLFTGCGRCRWCRGGDERICPNLRSVTGVLERWGGFAERLVTRATRLVSVPSRLSAREAAVLVDAGATAANAVGIVGAAGSKTAVVIGGGPVGFLVAELLSAAGVALEIVEQAAPRRRALDRAGHRVVDTFEKLSDPADAVVECAGTPATMSAAPMLAYPRGLLVLAGYARSPSFPFEVVARQELTVRGVRSGSRAHLEQILELAASRAISLPSIATWPLEGINEAIAALRSGGVEGKAVIEVGGTAIESETVEQEEA